MQQEELQQVPPETPMADGVWVKMGGRKQYLIPALNFKSLRALQGELSNMGKVNETTTLMTDEQMDTVLKLALAAIQRNYPSMTKETLEDLLDIGNFMEIFLAIVNQSGLVKKGVAVPGEPAATS